MSRKGATLIFVVSMIFIVFAMGVVRSKCVNSGYELSRMATAIESKRIDMERLEADRSQVLSRERLFALAMEKGFIFRQEGKTFNVQQQ